MSIFSKFLGKARAEQLELTDSSGSGSINKQFRVTLSSAQILALHTTPISLVAAPGTGKYISIDEIVATLNFGTIQYAGANAVELRYTDGSGANVTGDLASAWLDSASSAPVKAIGAAVTPVANAAVVAVVPVANPTAGDGTVTIEGKYRIVTLP